MANNSTNKRKRNNNSNYNSPNQQHARFAQSSAQFLGLTASTTAGVDVARIKTMIQDPSKNSLQIGNISKALKHVNGEYKRIIQYMSSLLTYDHTIYPVMQNPTVDADGDVTAMQQAFAQTAIYLDRLNPKLNLPLFTEKMFTTGVTFLYKLEDSKGVSYQEFTPSLCRIKYSEEGVYRFQFDVTKVSDVLYPVMPKEIQSAVDGYKAGTNSDILEEGRWYQVSDKGVAFTIDPDVLGQAGQGLPPFASSLVDIFRIEGAKDAMEDTSILDNVKIVHSQVPIDEKGRPTMELPVVQEYHNALKRNLPKGSVAITNPFVTKAVNLSGTGKDVTFSLLDKATDQLFKGVGVSQQLFANDNASSNALERSLQVDTQWMYAYTLPMFASYYNYELKKVGKKNGVQWKTKFLPVSHFDRQDAIATAQAQLSFGGSRLEYLAYTGMTPLEVANMLIFEQRVLTIDDYMIVKATSHTTAGGTGDNGTSPTPKNPNGAGAPQSQNPSDTTVRINNQQ
ncbi:hypothetical protein ACIGIJ_18385 [Bacillus paranthracis]|uniref:hypothetical protein n=2 Tax=Bacteria TaxID=2 RepID=UPI0037C65590